MRGVASGDIRWDVSPGAGSLSMDINIQDLGALVVLYPPMIGGVKALGGPACPWGP